MQENGTNSIFVKIAILALAVFSTVTFVVLQFKANEYELKRDELAHEVEALQDEKEELQTKLDAEMDAEYVENVAKKKLKLRMPEEIIFINNHGN